jgi:hypothetical protein
MNQVQAITVGGDTFVCVMTGGLHQHSPEPDSASSILVHPEDDANSISSPTKTMEVWRRFAGCDGNRMLDQSWAFHTRERAEDATLRLRPRVALVISP